MSAMKIVKTLICANLDYAFASFSNLLKRHLSAINLIDVIRNNIRLGVLDIIAL